MDAFLILFLYISYLESLIKKIFYPLNNGVRNYIREGVRYTGGGLEVQRDLLYIYIYIILINKLTLIKKI